MAKKNTAKKTGKSKKPINKLESLVKKKNKVSIKSAAKSLKLKEKEIIDLAMKLSDDFSIIKKGGKISSIMHNNKQNTSKIIDELSKIIKKITSDELIFIKKELLSGIVFLEKNPFMKNNELAEKKLTKFSKEVDEYNKLLKELNDLGNKSSQASKIIEEYSKLIDKKSKELNDLMELERKNFEKTIKTKEKISDLSEKIYELILGEKRKTLIESLGIKRLLPEKTVLSNNKIEQKISEQEVIAKTAENEKESEIKNELNDSKKDFLQKKYEELDESQKKSLKKMPAKFLTEIDELFKLVKEEKKISFKKLAKLYEEKMQTIEEWCEALEEMELITIHYPLIGSPYVKYEEKKEDKKADE